MSNKTRLLLFIILLFFSLSVKAETILSSLSFDWNLDGELDKATLIQSKQFDDQADLVITLSYGNGDKSTTWVADSIAWYGVSPGTSVSLSLNIRGSIVISSGNSSIGRGRWTRDLVVAHRHNELVIAGFWFESIDTVIGTRLVCDVNFLTGQGFRNQSTFNFSARFTKLESWDDKLLQQICSLSTK